MSELKVDRIEPALANKITLSPSVSFENATGLVKFLVDSTSVTVTGPLKVGTIISDVNTGTSRQILTSQGASLPPIWTDNFPIGGIIMWSGNSATVPNGWAICNGFTVNGITTPDLTNKFVVGVGTEFGNTLKTSGGNKDAVVVSHTHEITDPGHTHLMLDWSGSTSGNGKFGVGSQGREGVNPPMSTNTTGIAILGKGESGVNKNLPPFVALYYIMRVS